MSIRLLLEIIRTRFSLILLTLVVAVGIAAILTYMQPKRYLASAQLVFNFEDDGPFDRSALPAQLSTSYLATQLDIIRSQKVARRVVELAGLDKDPSWQEAYAEADATQVPVKDWIASQVSTSVDAEPLPNSRVVVLSFTDLAPDTAARMANLYTRAFTATSLDLMVEPARRKSAWFDRQLQVLRKRLEAARARMTSMQAQKGIVALDEKLGTETSRLDDITRNLVEAQMATAAARSRQLGENHPEYVSAVQRERALTAAMEQQKRNILRIQGQRDELDTLASEVQSEQQNYDATLQAYYKVVMESQFNSTNVAVLSPALPPDSPASPNVLLNMLSATVLGLVLGLLAAVGAEMLSPRTSTTIKRSRYMMGEPLTEV